MTYSLYLGSHGGSHNHDESNSSENVSCRTTYFFKSNRMCGSSSCIYRNEL